MTTPRLCDPPAALRAHHTPPAFRTTNSELRNVFKLDLHGQHVEEAVGSLERYITTLRALDHPGGLLLRVGGW